MSVELTGGQRTGRGPPGRVARANESGAWPCFCRATLNYLPKQGLNGTGLTAVETEIYDGRTARLPGWEECGFQLMGHRSAVENWTDDKEIAAVHYPEAEGLARRLTGCDFAVVSDHVKRNASIARRRREQAPVTLVHSDFAANYETVVRDAYRNVHGRGAAALARSGLSAEEIQDAPRLLMLQMWRNLGAARMDLPVAFCDCRTLTPVDSRPFRYTGYVAGGTAFDALAIVAPGHPSHHRWYTFPELTADEVVAFRTYDTDLVRANQTWFTPHSAFRDPQVEEGNPARSSIELRVLCVFTGT